MSGKLPTQKMFADEDEESAANIEQKEESQTQEFAQGNILDLPSKGKLGYPSSFSYRDMIIKDEEILSLATDENYVRTLNGVLRSILNDNQSFDKMCVHDRDFLLMYIWCNNYDSNKPIEFICSNPECKHHNHTNVELTEVPVVDLKDSYKELELPIKKTGKPIKIRLNTVADEIACEEFLTKNKDYKYNRLMLIASINLGLNLPLEKKVEWAVANLSPKERGIIKQYHNYFAFGVQRKLELTCEKCKEVTYGDLPFRTQDILFPTVSVDIEQFL